jgi:hypothetical protein
MVFVVPLRLKPNGGCVASLSLNLVYAAAA